MKKLIVSVLVTVLLLSIAIPTAVMAKTTVWHVPGDFATIQGAIVDLAVSDGDTIMVSPGSHDGAYVDKAVKIIGTGGAVIDNGPLHPAGLTMGFRLLAGSDGAEISHLQFEVDLAIMNGEAVDDVVIEHCTFLDTIQGISNWSGSGWVISHNNIIDLRTRCGGGIGILVADWTGGTVENNVVSHNKITGTLYVAPDDCGGYNGAGIVLYADFRWGAAGAFEIKNNRVVQNKVSMVSDTPAVVDIVAFEMTDTRDNIDADPYPVIFDNAIGFNDFRGTALQIDLTPDDLGNLNDISRNFGENRGHGLHPSVFGPGGN